MKQMIIEGNNLLSGNIYIGGAKNSAVALIPASILAYGVSTIKNVPNISDRDALIDILKLLNCETRLTKNELIIDSTDLKNVNIDCSYSSKLRASYYFMGALLGRDKYVEICLPGGCNIGSRPIDMHLEGFEALGAKITTHGNKYILQADKLKGADINLRFKSVGATINIMLASVLAEGITTIRNAAEEIEIINIADFLNKMGAKIKGAGTNTITIEGVKELTGAEISVLPDRIEAGTYIIMGALDIEAVMWLEEYLKNYKGAIVVVSHDRMFINKVATKIYEIEYGKTEVYPGIPTDIGQPLSVLLTQCHGNSALEETIWENRMGHVPSLNKMGANITVENNTAKIEGPTKLIGSEVIATDLRGGASLVIAGLIADGTTIINDVEHILRGYENIVKKLSDVGAKIELREI